MGSAYKNALNQQGQTPQNQPIPNTDQQRNSAGGYSFVVGDWEQLKRFLILGSESGSYYATEKALTVKNANNVRTVINSDGLRVIRETVAISEAGRAPKNTPAIFVLAMSAAFGDEPTRKAAFEALPKVCRIGTHIFQFVDYVQAMRGWGRGLRRGVGGWYTAQTARDLAYQLVKYRQREGWTHTDLLRLTHAKPADETQGALFNWVTTRQTDKKDQSAWARDLHAPQDEALAFVWAFEQAQKATDVQTILQLIEQYNLPREALPTQWLNTVEVWDQLLQKMPMTAMIRNLGVMSKIGLLTPMSAAESTVMQRLNDDNLLHKARIHPLAILSALRVYARGKGIRGGGEWTPSQGVVDALDDAFYKAFDSVEPSNKRTMLALDVSGSMAAREIAGVPGLTPRDASAALALVTARIEPQYHMISFQEKIVPLDISANMRLTDAIETVSGLTFGATDCAQPMLYALENKIDVDTFVIYTDSETWSGDIHPSQALVKYREATGIAARLIVCAMISSWRTIADINDAGMLDIVGMDTSTPQLINDFSRGDI